ncbi:hypothetical protein SPSYN_00869 [Sporotomaculum syntrophicum]|uniref:Uncharacterized protein n=1 Tax=Sporotomaculum syntrophicum TaxID=182264 RepID=A0A9D2WRA6_9FIRM|nr:hypothetical protein SPSYN_00869 [Sporotomaculum syntrophicum]
MGSGLNFLKSTMQTIYYDNIVTLIKLKPDPLGGGGSA